MIASVQGVIALKCVRYHVHHFISVKAKTPDLPVDKLARTINSRFSTPIIYLRKLDKARSWLIRTIVFVSIAQITCKAFYHLLTVSGAFVLGS